MTPVVSYVKTANEVGHEVLEGADSFGLEFRLGVLEILERRVRLEDLREVLGALSSQLVITEAANKAEHKVLRGPDRGEGKDHRSGLAQSKPPVLLTSGS